MFRPCVEHMVQKPYARPYPYVLRIGYLGGVVLRVLRRYWCVWRWKVGGEVRGFGEVIEWAAV